MSAALVLLASGGTGGHMFPAEALAGTLLARGYRVGLVTDKRGRYIKDLKRDDLRPIARRGSSSH